MAATQRFTGQALEELTRAKILGVRAGAEHRYTGVWVVLVEGRAFVRSWNDRPTGWFRAFQAQSLGSIQLAGQVIAIRGKQLRSGRLRDAVTRAYAEKYHTKASEKWVRGFAEPDRAAATLELVPAQPLPAQPPTAPAVAGASLKVLFIGNSFTARNDLSGLIARLAAGRGKVLQHRLISAGGASLRTHWNAGTARQAIQDGGYDHVVLQEQSTLPVKNPGRFHENVRLFDEAIKAAGARTTLYMTWARQHAPASQQAITDAYLGIGRELAATVVPVGLAWQRFLARHDQPVLHDRDQSHPSLAGSYLAACVFLAVLFEESPVGIPGEVAGLTAKDRALLQQAAWQTCRPAARGRQRA